MAADHETADARTAEAAPESSETETLRKKPTKPKRKPTKKKTGKKKVAGAKKTTTPKYPRHTVRKALRIPQAILDQNAGKSCTDREALQFAGLSYNGPARVELSSSSKYGFLERPENGHVKPTDLAKKIIRPQDPRDELDGLREAVLTAPDISAVYTHFRGENLPDEPFFSNALTDKFRLPKDKVSEFRAIFLETLRDAGLLEEHGEKLRVLDVTSGPAFEEAGADSLKKLGRAAKVDATDSCFVMMPFADPLGGYYASVYKPAIEKAGLKAVRADDEIFATGKIIDQVWRGIHGAKVLVAELTTRNANVFYELGLAHALQKPVVLVSRNEEDVPFDIRHVRVIYYETDDPFWGEKLINKIAENVLSAITNPEEALFKPPE